METISISPPQSVVSFTPSIEGPLRVLSVSPTGLLQATEPNFALAVTFSAPMTPLGEPTPIPLDQITLQPSTPGTLRWEGTQTLVFQPETPLLSSTQYTATLAPGLQSIEGKVLEEPYVWTFEMPRPRLVSSSPSSNELYAEPHSTIRLNYNISLDTTSLSSYYSLYEEPSRLEIPFEIQTPSPDTVLLNPIQNLSKGNLYRVQVRPGVPPATGSLGTVENVSFTFRVHPELRFESIYQGSDWGYSVSELDPARGIGFNFSTQVRYKDLVKALRFTPDVKMPADAENNNWYINEHINLNVQFQPETAYSFRIDSLYDIHGQLLTQVSRIVSDKSLSSIIKYTHRTHGCRSRGATVPPHEHHQLGVRKSWHGAIGST